MDMEDRETFSLIGSDKVEGTNVYGADGEKVGYIERVMIDKVSGKVSYAVLSFGGLLGIGDDHYPLPWQALKYDTNLGGYVTGITQDQLRGAPKYADESSWNWSDRHHALRERLLRRAGGLRFEVGNAVRDQIRQPPGGRREPRQEPVGSGWLVGRGG
ncbi:hypothetical protein ABIF99_004256 [Bradyrhizobium japonicum]|nr:hypothetical protein [Bradyrhizobium japonicum]MCP1861777.1 hypothetical protein [Bradyrhizobium japonicum]MCP1892535.1 hypothetical protein [Bradyrhizobium japonicum]MCW2325659.1 hypothetical protein [Bradyrhizobium japonicum]